MSNASGPPPALAWVGQTDDGHLQLLDQTRLPTEVELLECRSVEQVWEAIRSLRVRGAPAIGVAAAYGVVLGCQGVRSASRSAFAERLRYVLDYLASSRPTAVNLFWALERMRRIAREMDPAASSAEVLERLWREAQAIESEDRAMCAAIGRWGAPLLAGCRGVLTHCNTGGLATAGEGTALAVILAAARQNPQLQVYADETRPLLQGARLTTWELMQHGVPVSLICDSMAGWVMHEGFVQAVIVGADRITANGDTANKIGTYSLSVLARAHRIPFYVAAPSSTFDLSLTEGRQIPIEQRPAEEITQPFGRAIAPRGCPAYNPAFDVTPAENITAIITERGVIQPVQASQISQLLSTGR